MAIVEDPRRVPRLASRCRVEVRDRFSSWEAETEDLGPRGCQLVTARAASVGDMLTLSIASPLLTTPLVVVGLVCWRRPPPDARIGVAFAAPHTSSLAPERWFERLVAADPGARLRDARRSVALDAVIYLAAPPDAKVALSREELRVLRAVGNGVHLSELRDLAGGARFDHTFFSLLSRRLLTLVRAAAAAPGRWARALEEAEFAVAAAAIGAAPAAPPPASGERPPDPTRPAAAPGPHHPHPPRSAEAQKLYEQAVELLVAGNATAAEALVRSAVALAPADPVLQSVLRRFERHARPGPGEGAGPARPGGR